jgi:hypothetical protein
LIQSLRVGVAQFFITLQRIPGAPGVQSVSPLLCLNRYFLQVIAAERPQWRRIFNGGLWPD